MKNLNKYQDEKFKKILRTALIEAEQENSFNEIIKNEGESKNVQIQYLDDNFTGKKIKLKNIDFWVDDRGRTYGEFLNFFIYKNKVHLLVYQD